MFLAFVPPRLVQEGKRKNPVMLLSVTVSHASGEVIWPWWLNSRQ